MTNSAEFDAAFALAREALAAGSFARAAQLFERCTGLQPNHPAAWFLLGASLDRCNNPPGAAKAFARTEQLDASHPQAANALAAMLSLLGHTEEALAAFRRALALNPDDAQILTNIGIISEKLARNQEALACYDAALTANPNHLGALSNRGVLLLKLERPQDALTNHLHFVACAPDSAIGHYNCAEVYAALNRDQEALAACNETINRDPSHIKALFMRGVLLSSTHCFDRAVAAFTAAQEIDQQGFSALMDIAHLDVGQTHVVNARNIYCLRILDRLSACDWRDYNHLLKTLEQMVQTGTENPELSLSNVSIPFGALPLPLPQHTQLVLARQIAAKIATGHARVAQSLPARADNAVLRIGYVSPDYNDHAVGNLIRGLFRQHDRQTFTVYAYYLRAGYDGPIRQEILAGCDVFRDVAEMKTSEITDIIRRDGIDILIDLAGYTAHARPEIFASRPAPINISYLGYPGTSGADFIDYFVTSRIASPSEQAQYFSEKMIYLPENCFPYPQDQRIATAQDRSSYGLPQDAFVFCSFNNSYKIEPAGFATWMRLLQRVPHSVLWLFAPKPAVEENLRTAAVAHGIDPARLVFAPLLPLKEHLARYRVAGLFLDTFLYGAGTTGMDALWAGLPLLTCPGESYVSRFGASHLTALNMPELIAASPAEYEERAFHLATHPAELQAIREKLAEQRLHAPLFQTDQLVRQLEAAYRQAWSRHQSGLPPDHIEIG